MLDFFGISLDTEPWHAERIFFLKDPQSANAVAFSCLPGMQYGIADVNAVVRHTGADLRFVPIDFNPAYVAFRAAARKELGLSSFEFDSSRVFLSLVSTSNLSNAGRDKQSER